MVEDFAVGHVLTGLVRFDDYLGHHEGGSAKLEEIVGGTHLVHGKNSGENVAEELLDLILRRHIIPFFYLDLRSGKGAPIDLLVLIQRDGINLHSGSRHHVRRLTLFDKLVKLLNINFFVTDHIGCYEFSAARIVEGLDCSVLDSLEFTNHRLYFL